MALAASARLPSPPDLPPWKRRPYAWGAAFLLHVAVIAALLFLRAPKPREETQTPPGISVVFDNGGEQQTAAPPAPRQGPSQLAQMPSAPPPPPPAAENQPQVHLDMPDNPFAQEESAPPTPPQPQPQPQKPAEHAARSHARPQPHRQQKYTVMNNMSFGNGIQAAPAPITSHAMTMDLPQSDAQAATATDLTIKGNIGADWKAAFSQWVDAHKYYPDAAVEQDQQGSVPIEFTVDRAGHVSNLHYLGSSGSPFLDQAWFGLFPGAELPPFPPGTKDDTITIDATMHFELVH